METIRIICMSVVRFNHELSPACAVTATQMKFKTPKNLEYGQVSANWTSFMEHSVLGTTPPPWNSLNACSLSNFKQKLSGAWSVLFLTLSSVINPQVLVSSVAPTLVICHCRFVHEVLGECPAHQFHTYAQIYPSCFAALFCRSTSHLLGHVQETGRFIHLAPLPFRTTELIAKHDSISVAPGSS